MNRTVAGARVTSAGVGVLWTMLSPALAFATAAGLMLLDVLALQRALR